MTTPAGPPRRVLSNEKRRALRDELFLRVDRGDISLVEAIKTMRKIAGKTQAEYARLVGISPRILIEIERGIGNPTLQTLSKIFGPFQLEVTVRRRRRESVGGAEPALVDASSSTRR